MPVAPGVIAAWPGTAASIPSGWSRVASLDGRYLKAAAAGIEADETGGAATHTHGSDAHLHAVPSHAHTATLPQVTAAEYLSVNASYPGPTAAQPTHSHGLTLSTHAGSDSGSASVTWSARPNDPPHTDVVWIESDGTPTGIPAGGWSFWAEGDLPLGWTRVAAERFLKGAAAGGNGGATGGGSHTHTEPGHAHATSHAHTLSGGTSSANQDLQWDYGGPGPDTWAAPSGVHHVISVGTATLPVSQAGEIGVASPEPPFVMVDVVENETGSAALPARAVAAWLGTLAAIPDHWVLCDGSDGTPDLRGRFLKGASGPEDIGTTGGSTAHSHASPASHSHPGHSHVVTDSVQEAGYVNSSGPISVAQKGHSHGGATSSADGATGSATANVLEAADAQPPFRTVQFIQFVGAYLVEVTSPVPEGSVTSPRFTVSWSNTDGDLVFSGVQNDYQVLIWQDEALTSLVFDSGRTASAGTSVEVETALRNERTYYLQVLGTDALGNPGESAVVPFTTSWTPPAPVVGLTVSPVGGW